MYKIYICQNPYPDKKQFEEMAIKFSERVEKIKGWFQTQRKMAFKKGTMQKIV